LSYKCPVSETLTTLPALLKSYNLSAVAREMTERGASVTRQAVSAWALGNSVPDIRLVPTLAEVLRVDVGDLTRIIASQAAA